jgi:hypothetical protein
MRGGVLEFGLFSEHLNTCQSGRRVARRQTRQNHISKHFTLSLAGANGDGGGIF